jgi:hypothetical protein
MEPRWERVEEWRESAVEARREATGESGAGRDEVSESRDEFSELQGDRWLSSDDLPLSVGGVVIVLVTAVGGGVVVGVEYSMAAGGFWELASGVEGEVDVPTGPPFGVDSSLELGPTMSLCRGGPSTISVSTTPPFSNLAFSAVVAWSFAVGMEPGSVNEATPLPLSMPLLGTPVQLLRLPAVAAISISAVGAEAWADAADSWPVLLPTVILESVDLRLDMRAYSCADGTGGGRKGDPGDGKGDEDDSLVIVTVSEGVSEER